MRKNGSGARAKQVNDIGERLGHHRLRVAEFVGYFVDLRVGNGHELRIAAGGSIHAEQAPTGTQILCAAQAGRAATAADERIDHDASAVAAAADQFVTEHQGRNAPPAVAEKARDIGAADARGPHRYFALTGEGLRTGDVLHFDLMGSGVDQRAHFFSPLVRSGAGSVLFVRYCDLLFSSLRKTSSELSGFAKWTGNP
jgi:hypothetical protein